MKEGKEGKGIDKRTLVPGCLSGDLTAHIRHRKSRLHYRMAFVKDNFGIHGARLLRAAHNKYANFQRVE